MPGSWLTTGMDGSAARTMVRAPITPFAFSGSPRRCSEELAGAKNVVGWSCAHHHLAADADHVAVDGRRAGGGLPRDRLGHVDRQPALRHRVEPLADLAGGERYGSRHLGD